MRVVCYINDELCILAGLVTGIRDENGKYIVTLQYQEGNPKSFQTVETDVVFIDQTPQPDIPTKLYAQWAREKRISAGDRLITFVRFVGSNHKTAFGYSCKMNGIITVSSTDSCPERNVVAGLVDAVRAVPGKQRNGDYVAVSIYMGIDTAGNSKRTTVYINNHRLRNLCLRDLTPKADGTKVYVAFLCGPEHPYINREGHLKKSYVGLDFTLMGEKRQEANT